MLAIGEVHERSVHHDGFTGQVVAAVASEVAVLNQTVAVGSTARGRDAACTALLLDISCRGVTDTGRKLIFEVDGVAVSRGIGQTQGLKDIPEVSSVVVAA